MRKKDSNMKIRIVRESDAAELLKIYEYYVKETVITFEYDVPSPDEFTRRIKETSPDYPYLVCLLNEKIIGYAYAHRQRERAAYGWNAELSVYIDREYFRCGAGKALYSALIEILKMQNVCNVYGAVTSPNENSERLHEYMGFEKLGVYHSTGFKHGAWHDVVWFERAIGNYGLKPLPFVPFREIEGSAAEDFPPTEFIKFL